MERVECCRELGIICFESRWGDKKPYRKLCKFVLAVHHHKWVKPVEKPWALVPLHVIG